MLKVTQDEKIAICNKIQKMQSEGIRVTTKIINQYIQEETGVKLSNATVKKIINSMFPNLLQRGRPFSTANKTDLLNDVAEILKTSNPKNKKEIYNALDKNKYPNLKITNFYTMTNGFIEKTCNIK